MIISSDMIKKVINDLNPDDIKGKEYVLGAFKELEEKDSQIDKPYLKLWEKEKVMSVSCNDELWEFIKSLEGLNEDNFTLAKFGKIYFHIKGLIKKGFIRESKTYHE